ncbi:adipose-secreted signaling protein isoform 2-T2 [Sylvia borin]
MGRGIVAFPFPSHSRPIPAEFPDDAPRLLNLGTSDNAGHGAGGQQMATAGKGSKLKGTGVRFSTEGTQGHHPQERTQGHHPQEGTHVHFQEQLHDSAVMVTQDKDGHFLVKVGFLRIQHKYEITFLLPPVPTLGKDICPLPVLNPNLRVISITSLPEGHSVRCEYTASKEGVLMEELLLAGHGPQHIKVTIQARVMDRHHGTPMLLDGVRCVAAELEYDSEQSDWPGFD